MLRKRTTARGINETCSLATTSSGSIRPEWVSLITFAFQLRSTQHRESQSWHQNQKKEHAGTKVTTVNYARGIAIGPNLRTTLNHFRRNSDTGSEVLDYENSGSAALVACQTELVKAHVQILRTAEQASQQG